MKEEVKTEELKEAAREVRRQLEREQERIAEEAQRLEQQLRTLDATEDLLAEIDRLKDEGEGLRSQLQEEKERSTRLEMLLNEMGKMTASVAGKASQEEVLKALRVFVNKSKRKKLEKRIAVKEMVLEMANANGLTLPEEFAAVIDSLDDEEVASPTYVSNTVTVQPGGINVQQANTVSK